MILRDALGHRGTLAYQAGKTIHPRILAIIRTLTPEEVPRPGPAAKCCREHPGACEVGNNIDRLMRAALRLNAAERASMAHSLLGSLESLSEAEVEQFWVEEALRRSAEIDAGLVETIPAEQVIAEARARLK